MPMPPGEATAIHDQPDLVTLVSTWRKSPLQRAARPHHLSDLRLPPLGQPGGFPRAELQGPSCICGNTWGWGALKGKLYKAIKVGELLTLTPEAAAVW